MHDSPLQTIRRLRKVNLLLSCWAAVAWICCGVAGADDAKTPAGLRMFYTGHSFHMFVPPRVDQLVKSAGIQNHKLVGTQGIGGS